MTENKRFTAPDRYRFSHSKIQLNGEPLTNDEIVRVLNVNDGAFVENFNLKKENKKLKEENEQLKNDGLSYYLNETLVKDIKTLLFVLAFCEFPKTSRLSTEEFRAIARLQGFLCENIIDLERLKKEFGKND